MRRRKLSWKGIFPFIAWEVTSETSFPIPASFAISSMHSQRTQVMSMSITMTPGFLGSGSFFTWRASAEESRNLSSWENEASKRSWRNTAQVTPDSVKGRSISVLSPFSLASEMNARMSERVSCLPNTALTAPRRGTADTGERFSSKSLPEGRCLSHTETSRGIKRVMSVSKNDGLFYYEQDREREGKRPLKLK